MLALLGAGGADRPGDPLAGFAPGHRLFEVREQAGEEWLVTRPSRLLWFNEQRFPRHKAPGTLRVFTLGGSTTFGRPYDDAVSFSSWLRLLLHEADPGRAHEVINAGGISYASYRIDVLLGELLACEPDALVIYTGHNEFLEERTWPELRGGPGLLRQVQARLSRLRTAALIRALRGASPGERDTLAGRGLGNDVRARLDVVDGLEAYSRDDGLRERIVGEFRENLERIVERARERGVAVVLVKPASNLRDFSPFRSEPDATLDDDARDALDQVLGAGRARLAEGDAEPARELFREAVRLSPRHAEARFLLGRAELALGRPDAARIELEAAKEEDVCPLRAPQAIARAVDDVGAKQDVPVVDLPARLERDSRERGAAGLLGDDYFLDHVHPTIEVHQRLAGELLAVFHQQGLVEGGGVPAERRDEVFARHLAGLDGAYFARRDVNLGKVLGWAGKVDEARRALERAVAAVPDDPDAHFYLGIQLERTGRVAEAATHYLRAAELEPRHVRARFNLGKTRQRLGDAEGALAAFQAARALEPDDGRTLYEIARTYGALDRPQEGREALAAARAAEPGLEGLDEIEDALARRQEEREGPLDAARGRVRQQPDDPTAHDALGEALGRAGELDAAEAAFRRAVELDPAFAPGYRNLAALYQMRGDLAGAEAAVSRLVALQPRVATTQLDHGVVLRARGDLVGAIGAFRRAVALEPGFARAWNNLGPPCPRPETPKARAPPSRGR